MVFSIKFSEEKNELLKAKRGISFEDAISHIQNGDLLADKEHPSSSRKGQRIYIIKINNYAYVVPYVINIQKNEIFLKTVYPNSRYTKQYINIGGQNDK